MQIKAERLKEVLTTLKPVMSMLTDWNEKPKGEHNEQEAKGTESL